MKFNFIELPWCQRQSLPANFHESQYDSWQWWSLETWFRCLETRFLESRSWSRTSQVSSRSRTISVSVSSPWSRGPSSQVKMNVCSIWPFAQISDDFYNLDIWRCTFYFVTALFKELVLIAIIEMWGLESRSRFRTSRSRSRSRLLWQSLGLGFYDKVSV